MKNSHFISRSLPAWLGFMCALVTAMIIIGGATRLTNSGLSITEWKPITGALPPLSTAQWAAEFEKYKLIPEFTAEHSDMDLEGFKFIYFWEWTHRQLGRLIGLAFAIPFIALFVRRGLPLGRRRAFFAVLVLIGAQGAIGWWMVASGLVDDRVNVSQYRLAVHLGMAFIILGLLFTLFLDSLKGWPHRRPKRFRKRALSLNILIFVQIIAGAFVAGTHAGRTYNTWPAMDGGFVPQGYFAQNPIWRNLFENVAAIQFNHRILAYIVIIASAALYIAIRRADVRDVSLTSQRAAGVLLALVIWQVGLGVWTLLRIAPLDLSLAHQGSSIAVFLVSVWLCWTLRVKRRV